jgi:lipopolysaccharide/colanic/teichoic acid biosynthesis glycosyltransferase
MSDHPAGAASPTARLATEEWLNGSPTRPANGTWSLDDTVPISPDEAIVRGGTPLYEALKLVMDVTAALLLLIVVALVMLVVALVIRLEAPGSIFYCQRRIGRNGRPFTMLKFRTMIAERRRSPGLPPPGVGERRRAHKTRADPRVTSVGRLLRRTSIDELPQLINVLRGDMSLVGPRPELPAIVESYQPWQHARHLVRPGITGWWQINRNGTRLMHEDVAMDIYYVKNRSLRLDLLILARTVGVVVTGRGAF